MSPKLQVFSIYPRKSHTRFCCLSGTRILEEGPASKRRAFVGCQQDPRSRAGLAIVSTKSTCLPRKSKYALQTDCKPSHCVMIRQTLGIISQYMRLVAALRPGDSPTIVLLYAQRFADLTQSSAWHPPAHLMNLASLAGVDNSAVQQALREAKQIVRAKNPRSTAVDEEKIQFLNELVIMVGIISTPSFMLVGAPSGNREYLTVLALLV
jgi:hypothetical protein